jgi:hypothetical protein
MPEFLPPTVQQIRVNLERPRHLGYRCTRIQPLNGRYLYFLRELPSRQCHELNSPFAEF